VKSRAQLEAELDRLAEMLPPWLQHLRHEAQFWPQFDALADAIMKEAGADDLAHVQARLEAMLRVHAEALDWMGERSPLPSQRT
jgi:hypothetical protein